MPAIIARGIQLSRQVEEALREKVRSGSLAPGDQLPPENELAASFGVSRATVRDALATLQREGLVVRRQGAGTYVARASIYSGALLDELGDFENVIRSQGRRPSLGRLEYEEVPAGRSTGARLSLPPDEPMLVVRKLFLADKRPVIYCVDRIPRRLIGRPFTREDLSRPFFAFIEEFTGQRVIYFVADLVPLVARGELARQLACRVGTPLLLFDEVAHNSDDRPVFHSLVHYHFEGVRLKVVRTFP